MKIQEIKGTSSSVRIKFDDQLAIFDGELLANGFLVYKNTVKFFDSENKEISLSKDELKNLINECLKESKKNKFNLIFE